MNTKTLTILSLAAAGAVVAAVVALRSDPTRGVESTGPSDTPALFPDLAAKAPEVSTITVKTASAESNVELSDGQWKLKEKAGYPADPAKVRDVLVGLTGLRNFEIKTTRPELFKSLGVQDVAAGDAAPPPDPSTPTSTGSLLLTLKDKGGQAVASVIVGNTKWGSTGTDRGVYLRKPGDNQSYYADGKLEVPREPLNWVNNEFADVARDRVRSVTLTPRENAEADRIIISREKPGEGTFTVQGIPEGKQLKELGLPETIVAGLVKATFEDVAPVASIDFEGNAGGKPGSTAQVRTWDGLVVTVSSTEANGRTWWRLVAAADPDPFKEGEGDAAKAKRTPEEVKKEVDELNGRWSQWAYSPYSYKSASFDKKLSQELKDPTAPPPSPPTDAPPAVPFNPGSGAVFPPPQ